MRKLAFILGVFLTAYSSAGILSETVWKEHDQANRVLCKFFLCDNAPLVRRARTQVADGKKEDTQQAISTFRIVLQRDPQDPYRWADLGDAFLEAGQKEDARFCYAQVLILAPRTATFLLRVAEFHFGIGENERALPITARILSLISEYDQDIFNDYTSHVDRTDDILRFGLPNDPRPARSWLQFLIDSGRLDDARRTWDWITKRGYADDAMASEYVDFFIRQGHPDLASSAWIQYLGPRAGDYGKTNFLFNGDFKAEPTPAQFDWSFTHASAIEVLREIGSNRLGESTLRIDFAGTQNLDIVVASQLTFVPPGLYHFHASVRTDNLTTDQGIRFRISGAEISARMDEVFGQFTGTNPWSDVDHDFLVPPGLGLLKIQVIRQPSMKFDNKIGGTAWIDDMKMEAIPHTSPQ